MKIKLVLLLFPIAIYKCQAQDNFYDQYVNFGSTELCPQGPLRIPKKIHQIWLNFKGTDEGQHVNPRYSPLVEKLKELHPDWEYKLWKDQEIEDLVKETFPWFLRYYRLMTPTIRKHDAARYTVLYAHGGVYLDHDVAIFKNLEQLLGSCPFVLTFEALIVQKVIASCFVASVPKNEFLKFLVERMSETPCHCYAPLVSTGPKQVENSLMLFVESNPEYLTEIKLYSPKFLSPTNPTKMEVYDLKTVQMQHPEAFGMIFFDSAWVNENDNLTKLIYD